MDTRFLLLLVGLLYAIMMGTLSLLRREGLSIRFLVESLIVIGLTGGLAFLGVIIHPVVFLIVLYLVTMRVRLLVDLGNALARQKRFPAAGRIYRLAETLGPDPAGLTVIRLNQSVVRLQQGALDEAIDMLLGLLNRGDTAGLGIKNEAACRYNLGVAYERKGQQAQAIREFRTVLEIWPVSVYARQASTALERQSYHAGHPS